MSRSHRKQTTRYSQLQIIKALEKCPSKRVFTEFEDEMLKKYYPDKGGIAIARELGKTAGQVRHRAQMLGLRVAGRKYG